MGGRHRRRPADLRSAVPARHGDNRDTILRVSLTLAPSSDAGPITALLDDVTELKSLEAQFVQSQKMQALGQLAGGIAHDFNNLLTAMTGHSDLLLQRHDQGDPDYADLIQIRQNVNRAAGLVAQLLAFSRKQPMLAETLDLRASSPTSPICSTASSANAFASPSTTSPRSSSCAPTSATSSRS
jgi:signal transduction histidine kinase